MQRYITIGIYYDGEELPAVRVLTIDAETAEDAIAETEEHGNVPDTTTAYTDERLVELLGEWMSEERADFTARYDAAEPQSCSTPGCEGIVARLTGDQCDACTDAEDTED